MAVENAGSFRWTLELDDKEFAKTLENSKKNIENVGQATKAAEKKFGNLNKAAITSARAVDNISSEPVESLGRAASNVIRSLAGINSSIGSLGAALTNVKSSAMNIFSPIADSANMAITAVSTLGGAIGGMIADYAKQGIQGADFIAQANAQLIGLTHSVEGANSALAQSVQYYKNNPFDRFSTISATKQLLTFGNSVESVGPLLEKIGNVALANGVSIDEMARRYAETTSQSKVLVGQLDELAQVAPGIWDAIGKQIGKTAGEARNSLMKTGLSVEVVKKAFDSLVEEDASEAFEKTLARQSNRVKGRLSDVAAAVAGYSTSVEKGFQAADNGLYMSAVHIEKSFADILASSTDTGKRMASIMGRIGNSIAPFLNKLADNMPTIINTALDLLDKLAGVMEKVSNKVLSSGFDLKSLIPIFAVLGRQILGFVSSLTGGGDGLLGALGSVGEGVKKLNLPTLAFGVALTKAMATNEDFRNDVNKLMSSLGQLSVTFMNVLTKMADSGALTNILDALVKSLTSLADIINKLPTPVLEAFIYAIIAGGTINKIGQFSNSVIGLGQAFVGNINAIRNFGSAMSGLFKSLVSGGVSGGIEKAKDAIEGAGGLASEVQKSGAKMTRGQRFLATMRSGILNIALLGGAIAAVSKSLEIANDSIPADLGGLTVKLVYMAGVITAMGALSIAADKAKVSKAGITKLASTAVVLASVAVALRVAYVVIPSDLGGLSAKLGIMAGVVGAITVFGYAVDRLKISTRAMLTLSASALAIASVAGSLWIAYKAIPNDLAGLASKLGIMALAIGGMEALATVASKVGALNLGAGLLLIIGIAGTLALTATSLSYTYQAIPNDIGGLATKLAVMAEAIVAFGTVSAAIGTLMMTGIGAAVLGAGLVAMLAIAGSITAIASAISHMYNVMPADFEGVKAKIALLADVIVYIAKADIGNLLNNIVAAINVSIVKTMVDNYMYIADQLNRLQVIPLLPDLIYSKIYLLKTVIGIVADSDGRGIVSVLSTAVKTFLNKVKVDNVRQMVNSYVSIGMDLMVLQTMVVNTALVQGTITELKSVINYVTDTTPGSIGDVLNMVGTFLKNVHMDNAKSLVDAYYRVATELDKIQNLKLDYGKIQSSIDSIKKVVTTVTDTGEGGFWANFDKGYQAMQALGITDKASKILKIYQEMVDTLKSLSSFTDQVDQGKMDAAITKLKSIVKTVTDTGEGGFWANFNKGYQAMTALKVTEKAQEIVNIYNQLIGVLQKIADVKIDDAAITNRINTLSSIVETVTGIRDPDSGFVGLINSLSGKGKLDTKGFEVVSDNIRVMQKIASEINAMQGVNKSAAHDKIDAVQYILQMFRDNFKNYNTGSFKSLTDISDSVSKITGFMAETAKSINSMASLDKGVVFKKIDAVQYVLQLFRDNFKNYNDGDFEHLKNIMESTKNIVSGMSPIVSTLNGMVSMKPENPQKIEDTKNIINKMQEIKGDSGKFETIKNLVWGGRDFVSNASALSASLNKMVSYKGGDIDKISYTKDVVNKMGEVKDPGDFGTKQNLIWRAVDFVSNAKNLASSLNKMVSYKGGDIAKITYTKDVINKMGEVKDPGNFATIQNLVWRAIDWVANANTLSQRLNDMKSFTGGDIAKITYTRDVVNTMATVNGDAPGFANIQNVIWRAIDWVANANTLANNLNSMKSFTGGDIDKITYTKDAIDAMFRVNGDVPGFANKQNIVWRASDWVRNASVLSELLNNMKSYTGGDIDKITYTKDAIDAMFRVNGDVPGFANKQNIVWRAVDWVKNANILAQKLNGMVAFTGGDIDKITYTKDAINAMFGVNHNIDEFNALVVVVQGAIGVLDNLVAFVNRVMSIKFDGDPLGVINTLVQVMNTLLQNYANTMMQQAQSFQSIGAALVDAMITGVNSRIPNMEATGSSIQGAFWGAVQAKFPDEFNQGVWLAINVENGIRSRVGEFAGLGKNVQGSFWGGIQGKMPDEFGQGVWLAQNVINGIRSKFGDMRASGQYLADGFMEGAGSRNLYIYGVWLAATVLKGIKDRGNEGSPWKTTFQSGQFAVDGLINGLQSQQKQLVSQAESLADSVMGAFENKTPEMNPKVNTTPLASSVPAMDAYSPETYSGYASGRGVTINQTNNNYTEYSVKKMNRDLKWQMSII